MQTVLTLFGLVALITAAALVVLGTSPFVCLPIAVGGVFSFITGCLQD